jgi:transposase-like protein
MQLTTLILQQNQQPTVRRKNKMAWDDDKKQQAVDMYTEQNPTPETSMEIVKAVAEELDESPNGVRMILSKAGVYVKKENSTPASAGSKEGGSTRVSKADAQAQLTAAITDAGQEVDEEVISKLTGKAAVYLAGVISGINNQ